MPSQPFLGVQVNGINYIYNIVQPLILSVSQLFPLIKHYPHCFLLFHLLYTISLDEAFISKYSFSCFIKNWQDGMGVWGRMDACIFMAESLCC